MYTYTAIYYFSIDVALTKDIIRFKPVSDFQWLSPLAYVETSEPKII